MKPRLAVIALILWVGAPAAWSAPTAPPPAPPTLRAEAGLGGVCRPGRWMPVRIWLANDGEDFTGEVVVSWGQATLHRQVTLPSPSRIRLELYVRTVDVQGTVNVRLRSHDAEIQSTDVPVRAAPPDQPLTLCVTTPEAISPGPDDCTTTVMAGDLPRSPRGYDAADRVVWASGAQGVLPADARAAFERWVSSRALDDAGLQSQVSAPPGSGPASPRSGVRPARRAIAIGAGLYLLAILTVGAGTRAARDRPLVSYVLVLLLVCVWSTLGLTAGRIGAGRAVMVKHATAVRQFTAGASFLSMRGVIDYPAFDTFALHADGTDLALDAPANRASEQWFDENGNPQVRGVFGLGARSSFVLEGVIDFAPLAIERAHGTVRVTNRSGADLADCRFPEGFSVQRIGTLKPGQSADARELGATDDAVFSCTIADSPVAFAETKRPVQTTGLVVLTAYLGAPGGIAPASGARR